MILLKELYVLFILFITSDFNSFFTVQNIVYSTFIFQVMEYQNNVCILIHLHFKLSYKSI